MAEQASLEPWRAGRRGWWFEAWQDTTQDWQRIEVPATACPRIPAAFLEQEQRELGDRAYASEYCCQFTDARGAVFRAEDVANLVHDDVDDWSAELDRMMGQSA